MAKAKKKAKRKSANKKRAPARKKVVARLSPEDRQRLIKPGADLDDLVIAFARALRAVARKVKVPGVTYSKLESAMNKATKIRARLTAAEEKAEAKLAPMRDAAMQAEDAAYRMLLRSKKIADAVAEGEPDVAEAFAAFSTAFNSRFASSRPTTPDEDPSPPA